MTNKEYRAARYKVNRKEYQAYAAARYKANPEKHKASVVARRKANPEKVKAYEVAWRKANPNPKKHKAFTAAWREANPEASRTYYYTRRTRIKGNGGKLSRDIVSKLLALQHGKCALCNKKFKKYHIDHIVPIFHGGSNTDDNVQLTCPTCNLKKGRKLPDSIRMRAA